MGKPRNAIELARARVLREMCEADLALYAHCVFTYVYKRPFVAAPFHAEIFAVLMAVARGEITRLIINIAPRFGKTELAAVIFISWLIARNPRAANLYISYSDRLAQNTSDAIRNVISSDWYRSIWPEVQTSRSADSKRQWDTTAGGGLYVAATGGQITGFGAGSFENVNPENETIDGVVLIDDPIKPEDAKSELRRTAVIDRYRTTIRNRVNSRETPIVVIMQRLDRDDLTGYLLSDRDRDSWHTLIVPALRPDGTPTWPLKITAEEAEAARREDVDTFETQMQQDPPDRQGSLYTIAREYVDLPSVRYGAFAYCDVADKGEDYLFYVVYFVDRDGLIYIVDLVYSQAGGETTEPQVTDTTNRNKVVEAVFEANNGGEGYARAIRKLARNTIVRAIPQRKNKESKILTNAPRVIERVRWPENWAARWPEVYRDYFKFRKVFAANKHDDIPDVLTEIVLRHPIGANGARKVRKNKKVS